MLGYLLNTLYTFNLSPYKSYVDRKLLFQRKKLRQSLGKQPKVMQVSGSQDITPVQLVLLICYSLCIMKALNYGQNVSTM